MIKITLKEYKELRDKIEEYQLLIGKYNLLAVRYNWLVEMLQPKEEEKTKRKIGFGEQYGYDNS